VPAGAVDMMESLAQDVLHTQLDDWSERLAMTDDHTHTLQNNTLKVIFDSYVLVTVVEQGLDVKVSLLSALKPTETRAYGDGRQRHVLNEGSPSPCTARGGQDGWNAEEV